MKTKLMILAFLALNVGVLEMARRSPGHAIPLDLRDAVADRHVVGQKTGAWSAAAALPLLEAESLQAQKVRTFMRDGYKTENEAYVAMGATICNMRELEVELLDASGSGVFQYSVNEGSDEDPLYGFWIDYKGEEFNK